MTGKYRRRAAAMQCNPGVMIGALIIFAVTGGGIAEVHRHWTGIVIAARGTAAVLFVLAAVAILATVADWIAEYEPQPEPEPELSPRLVLVPVFTGLPEADQAPEIPVGTPAMAAEARKLAAGTLDFVITARGSLFELDESDEQEPVS